MTDYILVKIAPLGRPTSEVSVPVGSTISAALGAAASRTSVTGYTDLQRNGSPANLNDIVQNGDIIVLVPAIKGGY